MDIISWILGYRKGLSKGGGADTDDIDKFLDEINGEVVGEALLHVTFIGADGTELCRMPVYEGYDCDDPIAKGVIETPTKPDNGDYAYGFSGWSLTPGGTADANALKAVAGNITVYAAFYDAYYVTFIGATGETFHREAVAKGKNCPDPVRTIGTPTKESTKYYTYTFAGWSSTSGGAVSSTILNNITAPKTVYAVFSENMITIASGTMSTGVRWYINPDYKLVIGGNGRMDNYSEFDGEYAPWYEYREQIASVSIGNGVTTVGEEAFLNCSAMTQAQLGNGITTINGKAFDGCTVLASVNIPDAVTFINGGAFARCAITSISFPAGLRMLGIALFTGTPLTSATFGATTDWRYGNFDSETVIPAAGLADPATAATYLKQTYEANTWHNANLA